MFHNSYEVNHPNIRYFNVLIQSHCTELLSNTDTAPLAQRTPGISKAVANTGLGRWRGDQQSSQQQLSVTEGNTATAALLWIYKPKRMPLLGVPPAILLGLLRFPLHAGSPEQPDSQPKTYKVCYLPSKSQLSQMFDLL